MNTAKNASSTKGTVCHLALVDLSFLESYRILRVVESKSSRKPAGPGQGAQVPLEKNFLDARRLLRRGRLRSQWSEKFAWPPYGESFQRLSELGFDARLRDLLALVFTYG